MTIRRRTTIFLFITAAILVFITSVIIARVLNVRYQLLEQTEIEQNTNSIQQALASDLDKMNTTTADWAFWDDTYDFMVTRDQRFIQSGLTDSSVASIGVNMIIFVDLQGNVVFGKGFDLESQRSVPLPTNITTFLQANSELYLHNMGTNVISGIVVFEDNPMLISSRPVLTSEREGPSRGAVIMGRYLDQEELSRISNITRLQVSMVSYTASRIPSDFLRARSQLNATNTTTTAKLNNDLNSLYILLDDITGEPAVILRADYPRTYEKQSDDLINFLVGAVAITSIIFMSISILLIRGMVVNPVSSLTGTIQRITRTNNLSERMKITGKDEIGDLAVTINNMLTSMEQSQMSVKRSNEQIRTAAEVSRVISSIIEPQKLYDRLANLLLERFNLYYVGLFLVDNRREFAVLRAGTGEAGAAMLANNHKLQIGSSSMIGWCVANRQARIAMDVGKEAIRFSNRLLPLTRSEVAIPIVSRGEAIGALSIQSTEENAFGESDILVFQSIADSLAVAIENSRLFQSTQDNLAEIQNMNRIYLQTAWQDTVRQRGELTYEIADPVYSGVDEQAQDLYVPITVRDQVIGNLKLSVPENDLTAEDRAFIDSVATQTALALENARLLEETQRKASQEIRINQLTANLSHAFRVEDVVKTAIREFGQLPNVTEVSIHLSPNIGTTEKSGIVDLFGEES